MRFWFWHALYPALLIGLAAVVVHQSGWDFLVLDWSYDAASGSFPARANPWVETLLHKGGRRLVSLVAVLALMALLASWLPRYRHWRLGGLYVLLCIALTTGAVAIGKRISAVDCPWDLHRYGGSKPHLEWFEPRPKALAAGQCFPGGHSSGAFALAAFYFLLRRRHPRRALGALAAVAALGLAFSITQWSRGAHFPSHDLWSAAIAWAICLLNSRWLPSD